MPIQPYRLNKNEKWYAKTQKPPVDSSYDSYKLKNRIQEKADLLDDRIAALESDTYDFNHLDDINFSSRHDPYTLGQKLGKIARYTLSMHDEDVTESASDFLSGVLMGLQYRDQNGDRFGKVDQDYIEELMKQTQHKSTTELNDWATIERANYEYAYIKQPNIKQDRYSHIQSILNENDVPAPVWIVRTVYREIVDTEDDTTTISESDVLEVVNELDLTDRKRLKDQIDYDLERLATKRRGVLPYNIFKAIATSDDQSISMNDIKEYGDKDVRATILNDLAGVEGRRKRGHEQVWSERPVIEDGPSNKWRLTKYGEFLAAWLFDDGYLEFNITLNEHMGQLDGLGLQSGIEYHRQKLGPDD